MAIVFTRRRIASAVIASVLAVACLTLLVTLFVSTYADADTDIRSQFLRKVGDAPPQVQEGVRMALRAFADGYVQRDPKKLDSFMSHLFEKDGDILILGTDHTEWARGYAAASAFIQTDWANWGDFRLNADDSVIWSFGDVAWVADLATVRMDGADRQVRFSAILTRKGDKWLFRQVHFQWEDGGGSRWRKLWNK